MLNGFARLPAPVFRRVDVRDVATSPAAAMIRPGGKGERFLGSG